MQSIPEPNSGCSLWTGWIGNHGYGLVKQNNKAVLAHRAAWEIANGPIPTGMHICHRCDVRACVNVEHMFIGSPADNMADKVRKGRQRQGERVPNAKLTDAQAREIIAAVRVPNAKLTDAQAREIIAAVKGRKSFHWGARKLAAKYGVSEGTISLIALGHTWRDVASR